MDSRLLLSAALDSMDDMVRVLAPDLTVQVTNASYKRCFGDQIGKPCYEMLCKNKACANCIANKISEPGERASTRVRFNKRVYSIVATPIFDDEGEPAGTVEVFRDVTDAIAYEKSLKGKNKLLTQDASYASRLQREMFVSKLPPEAGVVLRTRYLPSERLGGDLFGSVYVDGKIVIYLADVCGHGVGAAMIALLVSNTMRECASAGMDSPAEILDVARKMFCKLTQDIQQYVTAFVAVLDLMDDTLVWASAGHNAQPLLQNNGRITALEESSLPICSWLDDITYKEHVCDFGPDGRLLAFTDGLTDPHSSLIDEKSLLHLFTRKQGSALLDALTKNVKKDRKDDVCIIDITRK